MSGAAWVRSHAKELGGRAWAEVYCGSPEAGAWVHVDPILGIVDGCAGITVSKQASSECHVECLATTWGTMQPA